MVAPLRYATTLHAPLCTHVPSAQPRRGRYTNVVEPSGEVRHDVLELMPSSKIVAGLVQLEKTPAFVRLLSAVTRDRDTVRLGDWVILQQAEATPYSGRVEEIMECGGYGAGISYVRIWCGQLKEVHQEADGTVWADAAASDKETMVFFECISIEVGWHLGAANLGQSAFACFLLSGHVGLCFDSSYFRCASSCLSCIAAR